ncbi:unnamed protein product [Ceutorhynchus assimilis]|uniref:Membrane protein BRI3 n=1 Tax=Ceutorhynchus assimilis TaxID=467358 RepID=A0A9N9MTW0_9CUCU|nr:unnamed protein product [Ceutorhynchus assimilis]
MNNYKEPPPPYSPQYPSTHYGPPPTVTYPPGPAPGYPPGPTPAYPTYYGPPPPNQGYGATTTTVIVENPTIIGACPACRVGVLEDGFTCLGVMCAIFFFPLGILCCLALTEKRCSNCGAQFS